MITKEQLQKENACLVEQSKRYRKEVEERDEWSLSRRKNFTAVLRNRPFDFRRDLSDWRNQISKDDSILTWEQIFAEVGKLIMCNRSDQWEKGVCADIEELQKRISNIEPPPIHHVGGGPLR